MPSKNNALKQRLKKLKRETLPRSKVTIPKVGVRKRTALENKSKRRWKKYLA